MRHALLALTAAATLGLAVASNVTTAAATAVEAATPEVFAKVGETIIKTEEFNRALHLAVRRKFYHAEVPPARMAELQREVAAQLVNQSMLQKEAARRGIKADSKEVEATVGKLEAQYKGRPQWQEQRAAMLPALVRSLETESVLAQLEKRVRALPTASPADVNAYYQQHTDKFTEPERTRVAVILLKVDPSSPKAVWDKTRDDAAKLLPSLRSGKVEFSAVAKQRSGDPSATTGGDMGYLHRGMLAPAAELAVQRLQPTEISEPVTLLQGVAIFRVAERTPSKLLPITQVQERARGLLERERSDAAWNGLITKLRRDTPVTVDESRFLPLTVAVAAPSPASGSRH